MRPVLPTLGDLRSARHALETAARMLDHAREQIRFDRLPPSGVQNRIDAQLRIARTHLLRPLGAPKAAVQQRALDLLDETFQWTQGLTALQGLGAPPPVFRPIPFPAFGVSQSTPGPVTVFTPQGMATPFGPGPAGQMSYTARQVAPTLQQLRFVVGQVILLVDRMEQDLRLRQVAGVSPYAGLGGVPLDRVPLTSIPRLPSGDAAVNLALGNPSAVPGVVATTLMRMALVWAGAKVIKPEISWRAALAGAVGVEAFVVGWALLYRKQMLEAAVH